MSENRMSAAAAAAAAAAPSAATTSAGGGGGASVCLVCDALVVAVPASPLEQVVHSSAGSTAHPLSPSLAPLLEDAIHAPLPQREAWSVVVCRRCLRLLQELEVLHERCATIKHSLLTSYNAAHLSRLSPARGTTTTTTSALDRLKEEVSEDESVFCLEEDEEELKSDDPEFDPALEKTWVRRGRGRGRGKRRGRGRGHGRGRSRGRGGRGTGRGPGRPPKSTKENVLPSVLKENLLKRELDDVVKEMMSEGEEREPAVDVPEIKKEEEEREEEKEEDEEEEEERPAKIPKVTTDTYPCPYCQFVAPNHQTLHSHKSALHRNMDCPHCGKLLSTWWAYERHLLHFHSPTPLEEIKQENLEEEEEEEEAGGVRRRKGRRKKVHKCETCEEVLRSRPALTYHIATKHSNVMYSCGQCTAAFPHRSLLASHSLRHGERRVMCDRCGRKFFTQKQLNCHENLFHRRAQSYTCNKCGTRFSTLRVLRHHIRSLPNHSYYCQECSAAFQLWTQYLTHLLTHGLRCSICHRSFTTASAAHHHYQTCHSPTATPTCALDQESIHYIRTYSRVHAQTDILAVRDDITLNDDWMDVEDEGSVVIVLSSVGDVGTGCVDMSAPVDVDKSMFVVDEVQDTGPAAVCVPLLGSC